MHSGLSALTRRSGTRILANWFLAASKGNYLAATFYEEHLSFFLRYRFPLQNTAKGRERVARLGVILDRNARLAQWWTLPVVARTVKAFPYFIFHYHFARVVSRNETCREIWSRTPTLLAKGPHSLIKSLLSPITDQQMDDLKAAKQPLYKLTWKYSREAFREGSVLDYLMRSVPEEIR